MTRLLTAIGAAALLAALNPAAYGQGQAPASKPIVGPWSKSQTTPLALAKAVDARLSGLRQTVGAYQLWMTLNGTGRSVGDMWINDSKTFRIEYPEMHYRRSDKDTPLSKVYFVSNGKTAELTGGKHDKSQAPVGQLHVYNAKTVADWVFGYPRFVAASIHGEQAFTDLIEKASKPNSGYTLGIQARDVIGGGRNYPQARILIERKKDAARRLGPLRLELLFSTAEYLPVTGTTSEAPPTMAVVDIKCTFVWQSSLTPLPADKFVVSLKSPKKGRAH